MQPYLGPGYGYGYGGAPVPWHFGHGAQATCYMIRNGRCFYY